MTSESLPMAAVRLGRVAQQARAWVQEVGATAQSVANQSHALITATRRAETLARKVGGTAARRPCVGVFGPSQAGKSYLVSTLARRPGGTLTCDFAGQSKDFLREINPPGDRESTGLVTRFTVASTATAAPAYPVELRLLSETDIVKILANAYFSDFDANNLKITPPTEASVRVTLAAAEAEAGAQPVAAHLDEIALFDLGEYCERYFSARIEPFRQTGYWETLIRVGNRLPLPGRARLFAPLWGGIEELTALFIYLVGGLDRLSHAPEAGAALGALVPRERSIIDVFTLKRLRTPEDEADLIGVQPAGGAAVQLPRALLAALVAELKITITETPWPFMAETDLLDFPGARSREKMIEIATDADERIEQVRGLLLRGKIAYLFQRFTEERELTAMLLCMPNNPAEVKDLAAMVRGWIALTHGETPLARASVRNALFLVLTKFDLEFIEKGGETTETRKGKWDRRLFASFLELYKRDGWPTDWDGKPFKNSLFLRNPGMKQEHLMEYAEVRRLPDGSDHLIEAGPAAAKADLIAEYRNAFLTSELCEAHFDDRQAVWSAALLPNDGGISFLVARLTATLDADLKSRQILERLTEQAQSLERQFRHFYHSTDEAARAKKDEAIRALRTDLRKIVQTLGTRAFTRLLTAMTVEDRDVRECFLSVAALKLEPAAATAPVVADVDPWADDDPWSDAPVTSPSAPAPSVAAPTNDRAAYFARDVMNLWADMLRRVSQSGVLPLAPAKLDELVSEIIIGADRLKLGERIAEAVRAQIQSANVRWDEAADRAVSLTAPVLNNFTAYLGLTEIPPDRRPKMPRSETPIFTPPPAFADLPVLDGKRRDLDMEQFFDWATGLHHLALENISFSGGREIDDVQNARLGRTLTDLAPLLTRA